MNCKVCVFLCNFSEIIASVCGYFSLKTLELKLAKELLYLNYVFIIVNNNCHTTSLENIEAVYFYSMMKLIFLKN